MIKAGSAGSNPDNATTFQSPAFQIFLNCVGKSVANINTIAVGLDAVENGYQKPKGLNISWKPQDRQSAARQARRFAIESALLRVSESYYEYCQAITALPNVKTANDESEKANKVRKIALDVLPANEQNFLIEAVCLLIHWRNRIVHPKSKASLTKAQQRTLLAEEELIASEYANLSIKRLLEDFDSKKPTLKDVSSLISMTINLAKKIDHHMVPSNREGVEAWLNHYNMGPKINKVIRESSPSKKEDSVRRLIRTELPQLEEAYFKFLWKS